MDIDERIAELEAKIANKKDNGIYGAFVDRFIICGKDGCRCKEGYKHGPYLHVQLYDKQNVLRGVYIGNKKKDTYEKKMEENKELFESIKELNKLYLEKRRKK